MKKTITLLFAGLMISLSSFATTYLIEVGSSPTWNVALSGTVVNLTTTAQSLNTWYGLQTFVAGDSILIAKGTYTLTGTITTKSTEVVCGGFDGTTKSLAGRAKSTSKAWDFTNTTIIDGNNSILGFTVLTGATLDGLIVQNCKTSTASTGAAATLNNVAAIMQNCIIQNGTASSGAGGVYILSGAKLLNSYIYSNANTVNTGGGVVLNGLGTISGCTMSNNTANTAGGGIYLTSKITSTSVISNNIIQNNTASYGAGIGAYTGTGGSDVSISNCSIIGNTSTTSDGAGIHFNMWSATYTLTNCILKSNTCLSTKNGSAIYSSYSFTANNCLISNNTGLTAVYIVTAKAGTFQNCTFASNIVSGTTYTGVNLNTPTTTSSVFKNCLFYNSSATPIANPGTAKVPTVTYCGFESTVSPAFTGTGCIATIDASTFKATDGSDWSLSSTSPAISTAIDKGTDITACNPDIIGTVRNTGQFDLGAYEYPVKVASCIIALSSATESSVSISGTVLLDPSYTLTGSGIYWSDTNTTPTSADNTISKGTSSFTASIPGASSNTGYYARAYFNYTDGVTPVTAYGNTILAITKPVVPTAAAATGVNATYYNINWAMSSTGNQSITYTIQRADDEAFTVGVIDRTEINVLTRLYTSLLANTTNYYKVKAANATSESAWSAIFTATTLPAAPTSTAASSISTSAITANWTAPTQGPAAFTYTVEYGTVSDLSSGTTLISDIASTNLSQEISSLAPNTNYYYRVKAVNTSGSGAWSAIQTATTLSTFVVNSTINASTLSDCPTCNVSVISGGTLTVNTAKTYNTITVEAGGILTNTSTLTATTLNLNSDATGTGTFVETGTSNITTANVKQNLTYRTWYMSSPVTSATPTGMDRIKSYNEADNTWPTATNMIAGNGYLVVPVSGNNIEFNGVLNSGTKEIILNQHTTTNPTKSGFNLIGNPYPSYLDWKAVYDYTPDAETTFPNRTKMPTSTMWYRTKVETVPATDPVTYEYKFWTVNGDGIGSPAEASRYIPPMQAFWVRTNADQSKLVLNNDMRSHAPATNKLLKAPAAKDAETSLLRLQVSNGTNTDEAVIYFSANASNGLDVYDSPKMSNENAAIPEIYTTVGKEQLVINGMYSIPLDQEIGLGFVPGSSTSFSIKANEISNLPAGVKVILKDNVSKEETELTDGMSAYQFSPVATTNDRFSVIFRTTGAVTTVNESSDNKILVYSNNNKITVICNDGLTIDSTISVYNAVGQILLKKQITSSIMQLNRNFTSGVYVLKLNNLTKKVIVK